MTTVLKNKFPFARRSLCLALAGALMAPLAQADERRELEQLRATTLGLIEALVGQGLLSRERADALLKQAQASPAPAVAAVPAAATAAATAKSTANVIRVPYVSETLRAQIREEVKNEVLATAREERWADPRSMPEWVRGLQVEGDVRVRWQMEDFGTPRYAAGATANPCYSVGGGVPAECYRVQRDSPAWAPDLTNTTIDRRRMTLRARLGVTAKVSDDVQAGIRLSTGSSSGPSSASQTLGSHFNRSAMMLDRAFIRWEPRHNLRLLAGRMDRPFYGSDLLWPDDLGVEGVAAQGELDLAPGVYAFANAGAFSLEEFGTSRADKWLYGLQAGVDWALDGRTQWRFAVAAYDFRDVEGRRETALPPAAGSPVAGTRTYLPSQYPANVRLKGNTLINLCPAGSEGNANVPAPCTNGGPVWGLASKFRPLNLSTGLVLRQFEPLELGINLDYVRNSGFDLADIKRRAAASGPLMDSLAEKTTGTQLRLNLGHPSLSSAGQWNAFVALRRFERDAWIDGFTDTTWHLGGTNYKGWQIGGSYAFDRRASLGLRLTSSRNLDDGVRVKLGDGTTTGTLSSAWLKIDVLQLDLNARF
ncbi:MAG: putative porin [Roseateles sp.]